MSTIENSFCAMNRSPLLERLFTPLKNRGTTWNIKNAAVRRIAGELALVLDYSTNAANTDTDIRRAPFPRPIVYVIRVNYFSQLQQWANK